MASLDDLKRRLSTLKTKASAVDKLAQQADNQIDIFIKRVRRGDHSFEKHTRLNDALSSEYTKITQAKVVAADIIREMRTINSEADNLLREAGKVGQRDVQQGIKKFQGQLENAIDKADDALSALMTVEHQMERQTIEDVTKGGWKRVLFKVALYGSLVAAITVLGAIGTGLISWRALATIPITLAQEVLFRIFGTESRQLLKDLESLKPTEPRRQGKLAPLD